MVGFGELPNVAAPVVNAAEMVSEEGLGTLRLVIVLAVVATVGPVVPEPARVTLKLLAPLLGTCCGVQFVAVFQDPAMALVQSELIVAAEAGRCDKVNATQITKRTRLKRAWVEMCIVACDGVAQLVLSFG